MYILSNFISLHLLLNEYTGSSGSTPRDWPVKMVMNSVTSAILLIILFRYNSTEKAYRGYFHGLLLCWLHSWCNSVFLIWCSKRSVGWCLVLDLTMLNCNTDCGRTIWRRNHYQQFSVWSSLLRYFDSKLCCVVNENEVPSSFICKWLILFMSLNWGSTICLLYMSICLISLHFLPIRWGCGSRWNRSFPLRVCNGFERLEPWGNRRAGQASRACSGAWTGCSSPASHYAGTQTCWEKTRQAQVAQDVTFKPVLVDRWGCLVLLPFFFDIVLYTYSVMSGI